MKFLISTYAIIPVKYRSQAITVSVVLAVGVVLALASYFLINRLLKPKNMTKPVMPENMQKSRAEEPTKIV